MPTRSLGPQPLDPGGTDPADAARAAPARRGRLLRQIEQARDRLLARISGPAKVGTLPAGNNGVSNPYRPNFLENCCYKGQNTAAPAYVPRP